MTLPTYKEKDFDEQTLTCPNCKWSGKGHQAVTTDFYGVTDNKEVLCPECNEKIATLEKEEGGTPGESANDLSFQLG